MELHINYICFECVWSVDVVGIKARVQKKLSDVEWCKMFVFRYTSILFHTHEMEMISFKIEITKDHMIEIDQ